MHTVLIPDIENARDQFDDLHAGDFYGGSDVASICGIGFESPLQVWLRKTGKTSSTEENLQMKLGRLLEPVMLALFFEKTGIAPFPVNQIWQHPQHAWAIGSPDAMTPGETNLIEFKTHKIYADKFWSEDMASDSSMCQLQWYLGLDPELEGGYCCALIGGDTDKFYHPYFKRDDDLISQLFEHVQKFRDLVKSDTPPAAGPGDAALIKEYLVNGIDKNREIDLSDSQINLLTEFMELDERKQEVAPVMKEIEDRQKAIKNEFIKLSAGAGRIKLGKGYVKISHIVTAEHVVKGSDYFRVTVKGE